MRKALMPETSLYHSLARFRFALRQFLAFSEAAAKKAGVTSQQYQAMLIVRTDSGPGISIGELAAQMLVQQHAAVQLVDRLAGLGLVERQRSDLDRRRTLVTITPRGSKLLKKLADAHRTELLKQEPLLAESLKQLRKIRA